MSRCLCLGVGLVGILFSGCHESKSPASPTGTASTPASTPTITSIVPTTGSYAGGTQVNIIGTHFEPGVVVWIGGVTATDVQVQSAQSLIATTGAHAAGSVDVVVTLNGLTSGLQNGFVYVGGEATPTLKTVSVTGGNAVAIGSTLQLAAIATYSDGQQVDVTASATWSSSDTGFATVTNSGVVSPVVLGNPTIRARFGQHTGSVMVFVTSGACVFAGPTGTQDYTWQAQPAATLLVPISSGCAWSATTDVSWITLLGPLLPDGAGVGGVTGGSISFAIPEFEYSTAPPRIGRITVRGPSSLEVVSVTQWPNCAASASRDVPLSFGADGGKSADLYVLWSWPGFPCRWTVFNSADWITITGVEAGLHSGERDLYINVKPNTNSSPRSAIVYAPGKNYIVTQAGR